jgi:polyhydroxyalkanoate synthesis regulator phasin
MKKIIEDIFHTGLGLGKVTKENVEKVFNELKKIGENVDKDRDMIVTKTVETLEKAGKDITDKLKDALTPNLKKIEELNSKIDELVEEINELKKKKG